MTGTTISPLRQRMIEDMSVRSFNPRTQSHYIRAVKKLTAFLGRSPDTANAEDLRRFQIPPAPDRRAGADRQCTVSALRFFYRITLDSRRWCAIWPSCRRRTGCRWC